MNKKIIGLLITIIIAVVGVSGCIEDDSTPDDNNTSNISTFVVSGETLYIPEGWVIQSEGEGYAILTKEGRNILVFSPNSIKSNPLDLVDVPSAYIEHSNPNNEIKVICEDNSKDRNLVSIIFTGKSIG